LGVLLLIAFAKDCDGGGARAQWETGAGSQRHGWWGKGRAVMRSMRNDILEGAFIKQDC